MATRKNGKRPEGGGARKPVRRRAAASNGKGKAKAPARQARGSWGWRLAKWALVAGIWLLLALGAVLAWYAYDLPDVGRIAETGRQPSVRLVAADGSELAAYGDLYGETLSVAQLPPHLPRAVLAAEDRRFYEHPGLDPIGLARAIWVNIRAGRIVQGGSTISQQLAKVLFLEPDRTMKRKIQELMLAFWLEQRFTKDQILTLYLNRVYLGAGTYGVDAAARRYFGKPASEVSLYEAAVIAGLLKAPSRYNPANNADLADQRAKLVLDAMVEAGFATPGEAARAYAEKSAGRPGYGRGGRYFADWIMSQVPSFVGQPQSDILVKTSLDPGLQAIAEREAGALLDGAGKESGASQAAFVALTPEGAVRAMVGGRDYAGSQFNRATQALRQPGSAFKAFVYLAALEQGHHPDERVFDAPVQVGKWAPGNYNGKYFGEVTLREAFARSLNSVAVRLTQQVGPGRVADTARRLGVTSELEATPSISLGTSEVTLLELTGAYAAFANRGVGVWPYGIEEITDADGRILYRRSGDGPGRVVAGANVNRMTDMMRAVVGWGTGKAADPGRPAAGKTGTSQDFRDAWFLGFTAELVAGAWVGNDDGKPMDKVTGGNLPARLWGRVVSQGLQGQPARPLPGAPVEAVQAAPSPSPSQPAQAPAPRQEEPGLIGRILQKLTFGGDEAGEPRSGGGGTFNAGGPTR